MKWTLFTILVILSSVNVYAIDESRIGIAPFSIAHPKFDCPSFLRSIEKQKTINIAWLFNTFGRKYACLNKILKDPRLLYIETQLINEPGHRNKRLENHEFLKKYSISEWNRLLIRRDAKLKRSYTRYVISVQKLIQNRVPTSICLISPGLESNVSNEAGKVLIAWTRELFPDCLTVWNPIKRTSSGSVTGADFIEQHSFDASVKIPCIVNLDGTDISFPQRISPSKRFYRTGRKNWIESTKLKNFLSKYNKCDVVFLWVIEYNCIDATKSPASFIPPTKRPCNQTRVNNLIGNFLQSL